MASEKPTQTASEGFAFAEQSASRAVQASKFGTPENQIAHSIYCLAQGLNSLSVGLRATYIKLEAIEALLKAQKKP
jgi:hypothetical protein